MQDKIVIKGAKKHNLKNVDLEIPRDQLVVLTGLSGSGKSSLAFDTIYAEGQRRYVESLSSYARMFLGQMKKPEVDSIDGLSPAISIDQKTTSKNPRSTVGTVTEIYDYFRLLYARIGIPHCPKCGREIAQQTIDQITDSVMEMEEGTKIQVLAPMIRGKKGEHKGVFDSARKSGFARVRADGILYDLSEDIVLDKNKKHSVEIVVDRLVIKESIRSRLADSLETASKLADGLVLVSVVLLPLMVRRAKAEEQWLIQKHPDYALYQHNVRMLSVTLAGGWSLLIRLLFALALCYFTATKQITLAVLGGLVFIHLYLGYSLQPEKTAFSYRSKSGMMTVFGLLGLYVHPAFFYFFYVLVAMCLYGLKWNCPCMWVYERYHGCPCFMLLKKCRIRK